MFKVMALGGRGKLEVVAEFGTRERAIERYRQFCHHNVSTYVRIMQWVGLGKGVGGSAWTCEREWLA